MNLDFQKMVTDRIDTIRLFDLTTGNLFCEMDQLKDATFENNAEIVYGTGSAGTRIAALNRNKTAKLSGNNGLVVGGLLAAQVGSDFNTYDEVVVPRTEIKTVEAADSTKVILNYKAVGATGNEVGHIYKCNYDGSHGKEYSQAAAASTTEFAYDPDSRTITLPTNEFKAGDKVIIDYNFRTKAKGIINKADRFPKSCRVVADVVFRSVCDNNLVFHGLIIFPKAAIDGNFSLSISNEPAVHNFSFEALQDVCSTDKTLWEWYIFDDEDAIVD